MSSNIILPRIMKIGKNASHNIADLLINLNCSRPLIVTDKMMVELKYVDHITNILNNQDIDAAIFDDTVPEPTIKSIQAGVIKIRENNFDCIIAIGGGSPIDSAKAMSILGKLGGEIADYKFPCIVDEPGLPIIAIPTTAGTGSEVTRFTIITDEEKDEKMLCVGTGFMPIAAIIDYSLTLSLPPRTTADTGIDALTHAIEAYVSRKANTFSDLQALSAMRLIGPNLRQAYHNGKDEKAREAMMLGSTLAGIAFSNSSVALVHGMSRPIGAAFHVPHGLSNAMLLPQVTEFSIPHASSRYSDCARAIGIATEQDNNDAANEKLLAELIDLNKELQVPTLKQFGVDKDKFDSIISVMAKQAIESGSPANNPIQPNEEQIISIYRSLW